MKCKMNIRVVSGVLVTTMLLSLCGCAEQKSEQTVTIEPMQQEEVYTYSFDFIGGTDVMPITGYYGPMPSETSIDGVAVPDYVTDEYFKMLADCGINFFEHSYTDYNTAPRYIEKMMELGEKYKIGITVTDTYITSKLGEDALSKAQIDERINNYSNYPAFCGVYVVDEPSSDSYFTNPDRHISKYTPIINTLQELGVWGYGNLFPIYDEKQKDKYDDYLEEWLSTTNVDVLQWDHYVFDKGNKKSTYFYNMSVCREKAEKYKIPFWTYVQAGSQWNDAGNHFDTEGYYPTEGEFTWNVNTCLAYGAKGIGYFPIIQPYYFAYAETEPYDFERNGLIGAWGNKNRWYYYAQDINAQIAAVDEVLMNAVNKGVIVSGKTAQQDNKDATCIIEGTSWRELTDVTGDAMIGCFNYNGKSAFYIVNYSTEYAQHIKLDFYDNCDFTMIQNAETTKLKGDNLRLTMKAGEGVLVVME